MKVQKLARISLMGSLLYVSQVSLSFIGNVELVSPLLLVMTLSFKKEALYASFVFVLLEGLFWGFGLWWFSYLYAWPLLYFVIMFFSKFNKDNDFVGWAVLLGFYGLLFGGLFALVYLPFSPNFALIFWINGFIFDVVHAISNFVITLIICKPLYLIIEKIKKQGMITNL